MRNVLIVQIDYDVEKNKRFDKKFVWKLIMFSFETKRNEKNDFWCKNYVIVDVIKRDNVINICIM